MPTPEVYNRKKLDNDLNNFFRLIKLKAHFKDSTNKDTDDENTMFIVNKNKGWTPDKNHHTIDTFVEAVKEDIECTKTFKPKQPHPNLEKGERKAIKEPFKRGVIIVTNADKGEAVVIVDTNDYIKEAERQLNDKGNYHVLPQESTLGINSLANQAIDCFKKEKLITDKTADGLKTSDPRTPRFYIFPKIHKSGSPGCPVVSSVDCHTTNISKYIDYQL